MTPRRTMVLLAATAMAIGACAQPFDTALMTQVSDQEAPAISITSPRNGSSYAAMVLVEGSISDSVSEGGEAGRAISVDYEVLSTSISGSTTVGPDGGFSFSFETAGLSGSLTLRVAATDWNANVHEELITLVNEGAVPSFAATARNQQVTLTWDDVPLAESYAVRYAGTGRVPTQTGGILIDNATSPLTISGLKNGGEYSFLLEARHSGGVSSWSTVEQAIPLSRTTLVPRVLPGYGAFSIDWPNVEGADEYEVFRATRPGGPYTQITGARAATTLTDFDVADGTRYYYAVRPAGQSAVMSGPAGGETTPFPETTLDLVASQLGIFNTGQSVAIDGDIAYVGEYGAFFSSYADLHIYDISAPRSPVELSNLQVSGNTNTSRIRDVEISGTTAYLTSRQTRIHVVDVSDPALPVQTAEVTGFTSTQAIAIDGGFAYVADLGGGLRKVPADTVDPADPTASTYNPAHDIYDVLVSGGYAYLAAGAGGLEIINLGSFPAVADSVTVANAIATSVELVGDTVYLGLQGDGGGTPQPGLAVIDVTTVGSSSLMGRVDTGRDSSDVSVLSNRAYLSDGTAGLTVVDVSIPTNPRVVTTNAVDEESTHSTIVGDYLFNLGSPGTTFSSFLVNPYPQPAAGTLFASDAGSLGTVHNGVVFAQDNPPSSPSRLTAYTETTGSLAGTFAVPEGYEYGTFGPGATAGHGNLVFSLSIDTSTASFSSRIDAIRVDSPTSVTHAGSLTSDGLWTTIATRGDYAYVGSYNSLQVLDISDPSSMEVVGFESLPDFLVSLAWAGDELVGITLELTGSFSQVVSFDLSVPESPELIDSETLLDNANWIGVAGSTAIVGLQSGSATNDLQIVDVSDPRNLVPSGSAYDLSGSDMEYGTIQGNYLYAKSGTVIDVVDIRDPSTPLTITSWTADASSAPAILGDTAYYSIANDLYRASLLAP